MNAKQPWWERPLSELDRGEWEALCDGCGKCCVHKLEDEDTGLLYPTNVACRLLDRRNGRCRDYRHRVQQVRPQEQQRATQGGDQPYPLRQVAMVPPVVGDPVFASVTPQEARDRLHLPCAMVLYLQTGPDTYRPYALSGGP